MNRDDKEDTMTYKVIVNYEEQYSIWPADRENARGWNGTRVKAETLTRWGDRGTPIGVGY